MAAGFFFVLPLRAAPGYNTRMVSTIMVLAQQMDVPHDLIGLAFAILQTVILFFIHRNTKGGPQ